MLSVLLALGLLPTLGTRARAQRHPGLWAEAQVSGSAPARASAEQALRDARDAYVRSRFARCITELERAEAELRRNLTSELELELLKRVNEWLGLCQAVAGQTEAALLAFRRAGRLPGRSEDPSLFPPSVRPLLRAAADPLPQDQRCRLALPQAHLSLQLDGRPVQLGAEVERGEHYAAWGSEARRSDRVRIGEDCRPSPVSGDTVLIGLPASAPTAAPRTERAASVPWHKRWWVWTLIAAGVAATATAITLPLVLGEEQRSYDLVF